ncbi:alpha/beta hydrolase [Spirosoma luteolum]
MNQRFRSSILPHLLSWLLIVSLAPGGAQAARVDTVQVMSTVMQRPIKCVIIRPDSYKKRRNRFPVVYLLHGYSGNHSDWVTKAPALPALADQYQQLIVCPDGANSWYFDSPENSALRYETFVGTELPAFIDATYRTIPDRQHRAITGLSMGGHGALYLAIRHRDRFAQAGSLSGGVDIRPFPANWEIRKTLGDLATHADAWERNTVINVADSLRDGDLRIMFECGTADFFADVNRALHQKLMDRKISHDYAERPGGHTWAYWRTNIEYQLLFFSKGFSGQPN